jgi:hypothetical protein
MLSDSLRNAASVAPRRIDASRHRSVILTPVQPRNEAGFFYFLILQRHKRVTHHNPKFYIMKAQRGGTQDTPTKQKQMKYQGDNYYEKDARSCFGNPHDPVSDGRLQRRRRR